MSKSKIIVVGAGWAGLAAAKTYLDINSSVDLSIFEAESSLGGIWSSTRIYPGLVADSPAGIFEYPSLSAVDSSHPDYSALTGQDVYSYLHNYASHFDLLPRILFNTFVTKIRRNGLGWLVTTSDDSTHPCDKLIIATGIYSKPNWPSIPNDGFTGPIIHSRTLGKDHPKLTAPETTDVVVVGGCKSAIEATSICLAAGKQVHWVIRDTGNGAGHIAVLEKDPKIQPMAISNMRIFGIFSPSVWVRNGFWYWFLHSGKSEWGMKLMTSYWRMVSTKVQDGPSYSKSENGEKIRPEIRAEDEGFFWSTTSISVLQPSHPFLSQLHSQQQLHVHRANIISLNPSSISLSTGATIPASALIYATGFSPSFSFFKPADRLSLGLPTPLSDAPPDFIAHWAAIDSQAIGTVKTTYPRLAAPPPHNKFPRTDTPFRLYRGIIPVGHAVRRDRSLAFAGMITSAQTTIYAELGALWAVAWLEDLFPPSSSRFPPSREELLEKEVAEFNAFISARYLRKGEKVPLVVTEIHSLHDRLMADLGLRVERKKRGWWDLLGAVKEWWSPYRPVDYRGAVGEFMERWRGKESEEEPKKVL